MARTASARSRRRSQLSTVPDPVWSSPAVAASSRVRRTGLSYTRTAPSCSCAARSISSRWMEDPSRRNGASRGSQVSGVPSTSHGPTWLSTARETRCPTPIWSARFSVSDIQKVTAFCHARAHLPAHPLPQVPKFPAIGVLRLRAELTLPLDGERTVVVRSDPSGSATHTATRRRAYGLHARTLPLDVERTETVRSGPSGSADHAGLHAQGRVAVPPTLPNGIERTKAVRLGSSGSATHMELHAQGRVAVRARATPP